MSAIQYPNLADLARDYYNDPAFKNFASEREDFNSISFEREIRQAKKDLFHNSLSDRLLPLLADKSIMGESRLHNIWSYIGSSIWNTLVNGDKWESPKEQYRKDADALIPEFKKKLQYPDQPWKEINIMANRIGVSAIDEKYLRLPEQNR